MVYKNAEAVMRRLMTASMVISLGLLGCACGQKNAQPQTTPGDVVHAAQPGNTDEKSDLNAADDAGESEMNSCIHADLETRDYIDMSQYSDEKVVEVTSQESLSSIKKAFWAIAREKADPETGAMTDIKAPIHAVVYVKNREDLELAKQYFESVGNLVTTFEIRISGEYTHPDILALHTRRDTHNRLMITGDGEEPVNIGNVRLELAADVIQIQRLAWVGGDVKSRLILNPGRLFEASQLVMRDIRMDKDSEFRAEPLIMLDSRSEGDAVSKVAIRNSYFGHNAMPVIMAYKDGASAKYDQAFFENVCLVDNAVRRTCFDVSVEKEIEMKHVVVKGNQKGAAFMVKGKSPNIVKTDCDISEENILHVENN